MVESFINLGKEVNETKHVDSMGSTIVVVMVGGKEKVSANIR